MKAPSRTRQEERVRLPAVHFVALVDGADRWWSLQPLVRPQVPRLPVEDRRWSRTPIDAFVISALRERGLSPSPEADRRTLIRRLSFDLTGLPPSPEAVERFVADPDPAAYEALVDRLLASPQYGERWAQHWLDVVHYADTHGYDKDKTRPHAWPYRDYVIRSLNDDRPYFRFVSEQLAGDRLGDDPADGIPALGFLAAGPFDFVGQIEVANGSMEKERVRNIDRDDMVAVTMNTFVSLTAQCARCHDHKFDPITQADYYSLQAVFAAVDRADRPYDVDRAVAARRQALQQELAAAQAERERVAGEQDTGGRGSAAPSERLPAVQQRIAEIEAALQSLPAPQMVYAAATEFAAVGQFVPTMGRPRAIHVLARGDERSPLEEAAPGTVGGLPELPARFDLPADHDESDRRVSLARWITDSRNPLTWRSIVNRIWQHHFGRGLVETPNDFGQMGALPTHPELLDWLAVEFRDGGQSLKRLHRQIVLSAVYRQTSASEERAAQVDAENRWLWRMNRRRLDAESIRDAVLAVSGQLHLDPGGPGFQAFAFEDDHSPRYLYGRHDPGEPAAHRRSIYRFIVRSAPDPFLATLDCADPSMIVDRRTETVTPLQALGLLNNVFMVRMADRFAERVEAVEPDAAGQLAAVLRLALQRGPDETERVVLEPLIARHGLANVCRLVFNMNEFVFVD